MDPTSDDLNPNPIVAMAMRIRARKDVGAAIDSGTPEAQTPTGTGADAAATLEAFSAALAIGVKRLNSILGRDGVTFVRLEKPLRVRLRFRDKRVRLDVDESRQLVTIRGLDLDGDYQFDSGAKAPALINLSKLSTEAGYGQALTPNGLLKTIAAEAELPRPAHLDELGPIKL